MYKALVIGCGSIGAAYDLNNDEVQTHAKAFSLHAEIDFAVADIDAEKAAEVAAKYNVPFFTELTDEILAGFDIVSLCVATRFHYSFLERLTRLAIPLIICEKPVVGSLKEVEHIKRLAIRESKVVVNYIRRFQPGFILLKERIDKIFNDNEEKAHNITIRYQRGFLNNCSHALDLLCFLLDIQASFTNVNVLKYSYDAFSYDPTATLHFLFNKLPITAIGFEKSTYSMFEIDIFLNKWKISISDSGDRINYYHLQNPNDAKLSEVSSLKQEGVLKNYMIPVIKTSLEYLNSEKETNFVDSLALNEAVLKIIYDI